MLLHLIYLLLRKKTCKVYLILVKMSPGNLLKVIPADLLHTLVYHNRGTGCVPLLQSLGQQPFTLPHFIEDITSCVMDYECTHTFNPSLSYSQRPSRMY